MFNFCQILSMKFILSFILILFTSLSDFSQSHSSLLSDFNSIESPFRFIGTGRMPTELVVGANLAPINMEEYYLQIESYITRRFGFNLAAGIAPDPKKGTILKVDRIGYSDIGKGHFIRAGADYLFI